MTPLNKPIRRTINIVGRAHVVTLYPHGLIGFRESRRRKEFTLPLETAYHRAVWAEVEAKRREKVAARKAKRIAKNKAA